MAINFPSTAGQATDGSFTYTVAGITYSWDGSSWRAAGAGASATDKTLFSVTQNAVGTAALSYSSATGVFSYTPPDLSGFLTAESDTLQSVTARGSTSNVSLTLSNTLNVNSELHVGNSAFRIIPNTPSAGTYTIGAVSGLGGIVFRCGQASSISFTNENGTNTFATISNTGTTLSGALTAGGLTYPTSNGTSGQALTSNGQGSVIWQTIDGLKSRTTAQVTVSAVPNTDTNTTITTPKGYILYSIQTTHASWITLYTDTASRSSDSSRLETTDPIPGSGVLAEIITTGAATQLITPAALCFNSGGSNSTYVKLVNKTASTTNITITLTFVQLEA